MKPVEKYGRRKAKEAERRESDRWTWEGGGGVNSFYWKEDDSNFDGHVKLVIWQQPAAVLFNLIGFGQMVTREESTFESTDKFICRCFKAG